MIEWIQGFLGKHERLAVLYEIWRSLPRYSGFTGPKKQYRQITMCSGTEMRGVGIVKLTCFTAAMGGEQDPGRLSAAYQSDWKLARRAVCALSDFCLIAQYRSHTSERQSNICLSTCKTSTGIDISLVNLVRRRQTTRKLKEYRRI